MNTQLKAANAACPHYLASVASSEGTQSAEILKQAFIQSREAK